MFFGSYLYIVNIAPATNGAHANIKSFSDFMIVLEIHELVYEFVRGRLFGLLMQA